jgi:hypothetical protein
MEVYFHERTENDLIKFPEVLQVDKKKIKNTELRNAITALEYYKDAMSKENYAEAKHKLLSKFGTTPENIAMINHFCQGKKKVRQGKRI